MEDVRQSVFKKREMEDVRQSVFQKREIEDVRLVCRSINWRKAFYFFFLFPDLQFLSLAYSIHWKLRISCLFLYHLCNFLAFQLDCS